MPNLTPLSDAQAPDAVKNIFKGIHAKFGMVPNIFRTMGHAPEVLQGTLALNQSIQQNLEPKLRELAYLKASQVNRCNY
jgi:alkylhydroperoxidase family enzyme